MTSVSEAINGTLQHQTLCVSLAAIPGKFGTTVHTAGYHHHGLNFRYVACKVGADELETSIQLIRESGVRGASVAAPLKVACIDLVDTLHDTARLTGAVNTVVNNSGWLTGYNTDVEGFQKLAEHSKLSKVDDIAVIGSGGAARAVLVALDRYPTVTIYSRNLLEAHKLGARFFRPVRDFKDVSALQGVVINCTPVNNLDEIDLDISRIKKLINLQSKETASTVAALSLKVPVFTGTTMALHQASAQFKLYTGHPAPISAMKKALENAKIF